ncbi:ABC transporter substrate-binding protein [Ideonella sp. BN130291]|uniref:ABC transporter substrate-binding protein n=1 Tax=Ideonella sp. BN130291 TaxID=3112940 RepID=UPI002E25D58E|nr:ABC transporter substrate-binding protein [Ideonella sp. BN130291]
MTHRRTLLASAALLAACMTTAHAAGTLTVCTENSPDGFDIAQYESAVTNDAAGRTIYDQLLGFKPGTTEVVPGLAEKWEVSPDGLVYTFHLRKGVKFHTTPWFKPTRELNADDVVWSINRVNDKKHPAHGVAKNGYVYWEGMGMSSLIKSVEKVDAYTVRFTLTRPEAPFIADMAMEAIGSIFSAEYGEQLLKAGKLGELNTQPVGSGPFIFQSYQKDATIRYTANKEHWQGAPKVDKLIFAITNDPNVRIQRLKAQECLVGTNMKPEQAGAFDNDANVKIVRNNALLTFYIAPNGKHKWVSDKRFREALWYAWDKKTFAQAIYGGNATPAATFLPPGMWSHDKTLKERQDVEKAKQLVKATGYDGSELTVFVRIGGSIDGKRAAELMQADWARAGIKVKLQMMEWGELLKRSGKGDHDITFLNWAGDNGDPDNFFTPNLSCSAVEGGGNKSQWCNKEFDNLIDTARKTADHKKRIELYTKAQKLVYDEVGMIPGVYPVYMTAVNKRVSGYIPDPFTHNDFRSVSVK